MISENTKVHYWQGEWIDDRELETRLDSFPSRVAGALKRPLETSIVLQAADLLAGQLFDQTSEVRQRLQRCLQDSGAGDAAGLPEVAEALRRKTLEEKLERELGSRDPFLIARTRYDEGIFEAWTPLGVLVHVSPQNSFAVGPMSVLEGLLSGNVNFLKTGANESLFPQYFLEALANSDPTGRLREFVIVARVPSRNSAFLSKLFSAADGIAAWGGEESMKAIRGMAPPSVRVIEWGHRISWIYLTRELFDAPETLERIALECCSLEQQACSSPQCVYLDTSEWADLERFSKSLAAVMEKVSDTVPRVPPGEAEAAEISMVTACHRLEASYSNALTLESKKGDWRIFVDPREPLTASPLYRSIWVKPLPREHIVAQLRPMRQYLQTVGLGCRIADVHELTRLLLACGVTRVRRIGSMLGGYAGEPHDGQYALQRYCRRIAVQLPEQAEGISNFDELTRFPSPLPQTGIPVTEKENFTVSSTDGLGGGAALLYFKSGGSSGEPKLSTFTYAQYDDHMRLGAEGLYAAGLDPRRDRAMNLFFCGGLYGGFLSIFSSLERLGVAQFPMAAHQDLEMVAETIIRNRVNVLLGMPSYLMGLFEKASDALAKYRGIEKIFYGGEHFTDTQKRHLMDRFGVRLIRSGAYGSVDIGPMGYQCGRCGEGVHHLQQRLHYLEILRMDEDAPVSGEETGRLVFSPRHGQGAHAPDKPRRYAIGDVGHWVEGACPCGRAAPRFKLLGRTGDVFRVGAAFLNYRKFEKILSEEAGYSGDLQIKLAEDGLKEKLTLRISSNGTLAAQECVRLCLLNYEDLDEVVTRDQTLVFTAEAIGPGEFERSRASGKLLRVMDSRKHK